MKGLLFHIVFMIPFLALQGVPYAKDLGVIEPYLILGGSRGSGPEQFNEPDAVVFLPDGRLLAGDTRNGRFKIYTFTDSTLAIKIAGRPGTGPCQFDNSLEVVLPDGREIYNEVQGIVVNSQSRIFVVDQGNRRILVFDAHGTCLPDRTIELNAVLASPAPDDGTTYTSIQGLAIDDADNLYLTDTGTRRIYKFGPDGSVDEDFRFQAKIDSHYILVDPESMAIDGEQILVGDEGNQIIKIYNKNSGKYTGRTIGRPDLFGRDVEGMAIYDGYLFALNEEFGHVLIFDLTKEEHPVLGRFGEKGLTAGRFLSPDGLCVSRDGRYIVIADQGNFRLQIFLLQDILVKLHD